MIIKYGFQIDGILYGWYEKRLYKLPHTIGKRSYILREIKPQIISNTTCYSILNKKITINKLKKLTGKLKEFYIDSTINMDLPF